MAVEQVGGTHYQSNGKRQHWDYVASNGIDYLSATSSKYLTRWKKKNGLQDIEKAETYIKKRLEVLKNGIAPYPLQEFVDDNDIGIVEAMIISKLEVGDQQSLEDALALIQELKKQASE